MSCVKKVGLFSETKMKINIESHQVMKFWAAEVTGNYWFVASCFELIRAASIVIPPVDPKNTFMRGLAGTFWAAKRLRLDSETNGEAA